MMIKNGIFNSMIDKLRLIMVIYLYKIRLICRKEGNYATVFWTSAVFLLLSVFNFLCFFRGGRSVKYQNSCRDSTVDISSCPFDHFDSIEKTGR